MGVASLRAAAAAASSLQGLASSGGNMIQASLVREPVTPGLPAGKRASERLRPSCRPGNRQAALAAVGGAQPRAHRQKGTSVEEMLGGEFREPQNYPLSGSCMTPSHLDRRGAAAPLALKQTAAS